MSRVIARPAARIPTNSSLPNVEQFLMASLFGAAIWAHKAKLIAMASKAATAVLTLSTYIPEVPASTLPPTPLIVEYLHDGDELLTTGLRSNARNDERGTDTISVIARTRRGHGNPGELDKNLVIPVKSPYLEGGNTNNYWGGDYTPLVIASIAAQSSKSYRNQDIIFQEPASLVIKKQNRDLGNSAFTALPVEPAAPVVAPFQAAPEAGLISPSVIAEPAVEAPSLPPLPFLQELVDRVNAPKNPKPAAAALNNMASPPFVSNNLGEKQYPASLNGIPPLDLSSAFHPGDGNKGPSADKDQKLLVNPDSNLIVAPPVVPIAPAVPSFHIAAQKLNNNSLASGLSKEVDRASAIDKQPVNARAHSALSLHLGNVGIPQNKSP
ncbi:MAG: hypothetical protein WCG04_01590 [Alphaproteobacteria bacterium]